MSIEKAANAAIGSGSGAAVIFGLTPSEWSVVGVIGGLLIALAGLFVQVWFQNKRLQIVRGMAVVNDED